MTSTKIFIFATLILLASVNAVEVDLADQPSKETLEAVEKMTNDQAENTEAEAEVQESAPESTTDEPTSEPEETTEATNEAETTAEETTEATNEAETTAEEPPMTNLHSTTFSTEAYDLANTEHSSNLVTVFHDSSPFSQAVVDFFTQHSPDFKDHHFAVMMVGDQNATELLNQTHPMNSVPFFCFKGKSTHCHDLLEAKWNRDANKTLAYVTKKLNPGHKYSAFVKEPSRPCCMNKMM